MRAAWQRDVALSGRDDAVRRDLTQKILETLAALRRLGEPIAEEDEAFAAQHASAHMHSVFVSARPALPYPAIPHLPPLDIATESNRMRSRQYSDPNAPRHRSTQPPHDACGLSSSLPLSLSSVLQSGLGLVWVLEWGARRRRLRREGMWTCER